MSKSKKIKMPLPDWAGGGMFEINDTPLERKAFAEELGRLHLRLVNKALRESIKEM